MPARGPLGPLAILWRMTDLQDAGPTLLRRRPSFRDSLAIYGDILETWARWSPPRPLA